MKMYLIGKIREYMKRYETACYNPELDGLLGTVISYIVENEMELRKHRKNGKKEDEECIC